MSSKDKETAEDKAHELHVAWINGNKKNVLRALTAMSSTRAAFTAAKIAELLLEYDDGIHFYSFIRALQGRLD